MRIAAHVLVLLSAAQDPKKILAEVKRVDLLNFALVFRKILQKSDAIFVLHYAKVYRIFSLL